MKRTSKLTIGLLLTLSVAAPANAQDIPFDAEAPANTNAPLPAEPPPESAASDIPAPTAEDKSIYAEPSPVPQKAQAPRKLPRAELSGLGNLAPFSDIAVISKRFLPKTKRFEFSPSIGLILNDAFFNNFVYNLRVSYYLREQYGIELEALGLSTENKGVTDSLAFERGVNTQSLATPKTYYGAAFKWVPIYGKMGLLNKTIVPFDTYFVFGGGVTETNQSTTPPTLHLGTGQIYAINKWLAARWDFSWFGYSSTSTVEGTTSTSFFTNLHISIGASFFFPGAGYR